MEIFEGIGHSLSLDDARLLMKRMELRKQGGARALTLYAFPGLSGPNKAE